MRRRSTTASRWTTSRSSLAQTPSSARQGSTGGSRTFRRRRRRQPPEGQPTGNPGPHTKDQTMTRILCLGVALALGVAAVANGLLMLASPEGWYFAVPGVTTTGPFNQHFIRDIGLIFLFIGAAFLAGAALPRYRV